MSKKKIVGIIASSIVGGTAIVTWIMKKKAKKTTYKAESIEESLEKGPQNVERTTENIARLISSIIN